VSIRLNKDKVWPDDPLDSQPKASHDVTVTVIQGDVVSFVSARKDAVGKNSNPESMRVTCNPVITYLQSVPAVWQPNAAGSRNLALNKYARSKVLVSSYRPFDVVAPEHCLYGSR
jgi:hypothetical protein